MVCVIGGFEQGWRCWPACGLSRATHTLPTHRPLFIGLLLGVIVIVVALTYIPALALGPLAEGLH